MGTFDVIRDYLVEKKNVKFQQEILLESIQLLFLFFLTVIVVYRMPRSVGYAFVLSIASLFWISKKNYFWLAYFFIIICSPGSFFSEGGSIMATYRLPLFSVGKGFSFTTHEIFMSIAFIKALVFGRRYKYILSKPIKYILMYGVLLVVLSVTVYGASIKTLVFFMRKLAFYSYLISIPFLMKRRENIVKFIYLLFPIIGFIFFTAVYFFITGDHLLHLLNPGSLSLIKMLGEEHRFAMFGGGHILVLFGFIFSLLLAIIDKRQNAYLYLIAILSYLSLLMTATRVWFLVLTLILIFFVVKSKRFGKTAIFLFVVFSIGLLVSSYNISSKSKTRATTERLTSVFSLGEKDSAASQMIDYKWRQRLPKVIDGFKENPIFGWGFSNKAYRILDDDVGNFSLLAETGILGLLLFIFFWVKYFKLISKTKKISAKNSPLFNGFSILNISFFGFLLAHFSTHQFFGLTLAQYHLFFICIFLFLSEFFVWENFRLVKETQVLQTSNL